jgi:ethanolamine utilization protein EutN
MKLAVVIGQVVSTIKCGGFEQDRLLLVDFIGADGKPEGSPEVAADGIGAGNGEWVLVVSGSSARKTHDTEVPIDLSIIGIVDEVVVRDELIFHK